MVLRPWSFSPQSIFSRRKKSSSSASSHSSRLASKENLPTSEPGLNVLPSSYDDNKVQPPTVGKRKRERFRFRFRRPGKRSFLQKHQRQEYQTPFYPYQRPPPRQYQWRDCNSPLDWGSRANSSTTCGGHYDSSYGCDNSLATSASAECEGSTSTGVDQDHYYSYYPPSETATEPPYTDPFSLSPAAPLRNRHDDVIAYGSDVIHHSSDVIHHSSEVIQRTREAIHRSCDLINLTYSSDAINLKRTCDFVNNEHFDNRIHETSFDRDIINNNRDVGHAFRNVPCNNRDVVSRVSSSELAENAEDDDDDDDEYLLGFPRLTRPLSWEVNPLDMYLQSRHERAMVRLCALLWIIKLEEDRSLRRARRWEEEEEEAVVEGERDVSIEAQEDGLGRVHSPVKGELGCGDCEGKTELQLVDQLRHQRQRLKSHEDGLESTTQCDIPSSTVIIRDTDQARMGRTPPTQVPSHC